jgi:transcriptional regulator with XRE-family HTH domain
MEMWNERLKLLRNEAQIYQYDLADKIGVSRYLICRWENAKSYPDPDSILKLCDYFNVSADYLLGRTNVRLPDPTEPLPDPEKSL